MSMFGRNIHLQMLLRKGATTKFQNPAIQAACRGAFHKPDPKPYKKYNFTRRYHLDDINTVLYSDFAPEYHMHLHSIQIKNGREGIILICAYFLAIILPCWLVARNLHKISGSMMFPCVRPGPDHEHMAPRLLNHLRQNDHEKSPDFFGRNNAQFYRNFCRQVRDPVPDYV
jgi:hypothetical protein